MSGIRIDIPKKELNDFCRRYHVIRLALFGSVLHENFNIDSDIDVLVVFDPAAHITFVTLGRMKRELSVILQRPVDLVPQDGLKPLIRDAVLADAQGIYAT